MPFSGECNNFTGHGVSGVDQLQGAHDITAAPGFEGDREKGGGFIVVGLVKYPGPGKIEVFSVVGVFDIYGPFGVKGMGNHIVVIFAPVLVVKRHGDHTHGDAACPALFEAEAVVQHDLKL